MGHFSLYGYAMCVSRLHSYTAQQLICVLIVRAYVLCVHVHMYVHVYAFVRV